MLLTETRQYFIDDELIEDYFKCSLLRKKYDFWDISAIIDDLMSQSTRSIQRDDSDLRQLIINKLGDLYEPD